MSDAPVKAILGYDIVEGVSVDEYEKWLHEMHIPDLLANPYIDRAVFNRVLRPVTTTSAGTATVADPQTFYRVAELHFADHDAYGKYLQWFRDNPIPIGRSPAGRTEFRFYVLCDSVTADRTSEPSFPEAAKPAG